VPTFPQRDFKITDYGAIANTPSESTEAIRRSIEACHAAGGGRVVVPQGVFITGAIHLRSNVNLYLAEGAKLKFSEDPSQYLPVVFTRFEGIECLNFSPLIYAFEQENIAVTGTGVLDGSASNENWWAWARRGQDDADSRAKPDIRQLLDYGERGVPVAKRVFGQGHFLRPNFIQPYRSRNVLIEGITIRNSPMWEIHPVLCTNVTVRGVKVSTHGPNNDGCDPESVDHMLIEACLFDTGDDCIAVNSGRNADGRRLATPSQNILIRNCHMKEGHGGVVVGSQISGGARWVFAENCEMDSPNLWYAIRFKNNALRGGLLENFYYRDLNVGQVGRAAITCDFNYEEGANGIFTPQLRNVVVERLRVKHAVRVLDSQGLPKAPVNDITLRDCEFAGVTAPSVVNFTRAVNLEKVRVNGKLVRTLT